jgi:hypothetical protein
MTGARAIHLFAVRYETEHWTDAGGTPSIVLRPAIDTVKQYGGILQLYWPCNDPVADLIVEGDQSLELAASRIAEMAGGALAGYESYDLQVPVGTIFDLHTSYTDAIPPPSWRCRGCGRNRLPHDEKCPFRLDLGRTQAVSLSPELTR